MTSRDKVRKVLAREPIDGIVMDFGAMRSTGINAMAYNKLLKHLGMQDKCAVVYDVFQQLALPHMEVIDRFGGDVVQVHRYEPAFGINIARWKDDVLQDGSPCKVPYDLNPVLNADGSKDIIQGGKCIARMPKGGFYYDQIYRPLQDVEEIEELDSFNPPVMTDDEVDFIAKEVEDAYNNTDKAILLCFGGNIFEAGQGDFGYENFYANLAGDKELMHAYFDKLATSYVKSLEKLMPRVAGKVDVIQFGDDLGTQSALQISVDMYREMIKPYHSRIYQFIQKNYPQSKVFLHCCGAIFDVIPDLIDAGVQILNPVQISAKGMDPQRLKDAYGKDIIFWGAGANMQTFVQNASVEEICKHVEELIGIFSKGGGFVFTQVHNIQYDVPPEKVVAIYDTAKKFKA